MLRGSMRWVAMFISYSVRVTPSMPICFINRSAWRNKGHRKKLKNKHFNFTLYYHNKLMFSGWDFLPFSWPEIFVSLSGQKLPPPIWCCNMLQLQRWSVSAASPPPHFGWEGGGGRPVGCHSTWLPPPLSAQWARRTKWLNQSRKDKQQTG